ncbi:MAG TPA: TadE family protein [Nocardioidaceae bacterium]|nr:TadE family protein [Nocardioidaceae bacterium]
MMLAPQLVLRRLARGIAHRIATPRGQSGAAALEFGLVFPVVLLVIFGIIQYGYHFWSLHTASATAREAARRLVVGTDWGCTQEIAAQHADSPAVGSTPPVVTREYHTDGGAAQSAPVVGSLVTVTVSFQSLHLGMPFLPVPDGAAITQSQSGRIENVPPRRLKCDDTQDYVEGTGTY